MRSVGLIPLGLLLAAGRSLAEEPMRPLPDKSGYTLFHPVPDDLLRELDTDRPDKTNSPHTLDAGHFQIETGLAVFTRDTDSGVRTETWTWVDTDSRMGLTNWAEVQLEVPLYESIRETDLASDETQRHSGIGDLSVVLKTNLWGNDAGDTAGGLSFFVKTPTASHGVGNGRVEGGATFLFELKLPADFDLGINDGIGVDVDDDGSHRADIVNSISIGHPIVGPLSGYLEFFSSVPTRDAGNWEGTVDLGSTLTIGTNFQLDAGLNISVTPAADDLQPFLGASYRF